MGLVKIILACAMLGTLLPTAWFVFYFAYPEQASSAIAVGSGALVLIWPSSLLMLGDPLDENLALPLLSVAINAALYGSVGGALWYGYKNSRLLFWIVLGIVALAWGGLLSIYY